MSYTASWSSWCVMGDHTHCKFMHCQCDAEGCECKATKTPPYHAPAMKAAPPTKDEDEDEEDAA